VAAVFSGLLGLDVIVERCREPGLKTSEEIRRACFCSAVSR
jgi:hypothetical protein